MKKKYLVMVILVIYLTTLIFSSSAVAFDCGEGNHCYFDTHCCYDYRTTDTEYHDHPIYGFCTYQTRYYWSNASCVYCDAHWHQSVHPHEMMHSVCYATEWSWEEVCMETQIHPNHY